MPQAMRQPHPRQREGLRCHQNGRAQLVDHLGSRVPMPPHLLRTKLGAVTPMVSSCCRWASTHRSSGSKKSPRLSATRGEALTWWQRLTRKPQLDWECLARSRNGAAKCSHRWGKLRRRGGSMNQNCRRRLAYATESGPTGTLAAPQNANGGAEEGSSSTISRAYAESAVDLRDAVGMQNPARSQVSIAAYWKRRGRQQDVQARLHHGHPRRHFGGEEL
mmetsp:Transcript_28677/g.78848  ORF Transcript_28677/g.78848 Transcript_28677/m.78848 type:complete len:219 (+) Transcript_28677:1544-2200(+)